MEVLAKDLCKPDVVAAIAKQRFFSIKDKPNLTPEIWEIFRDMTRNVHHTQPVDPEDLEAKLRNCSPRLSEPPTSPHDCSSRFSETPTEGPEEKMKRYKLEANRAYDTLTQMGGRPTRPIRCNLHWKTVVFGGEQFYQEIEEDEELFYYGIDKPRRAPRPTEANVIVSHWVTEKMRVDEELQRWQDFLDSQQRRREHHPEFAKEEDMERWRYPHDPQLTASLKKLKNWKEYQAYFQKGIDRLKRGMEGARRAVETIQRKAPEVVVNKGKVRGRSHKDWLRTIEEQREKLAAEKKRLEWVKKQLPALLSECAASLTELPTSRRQMEERSELEVKQVYITLVDTGGRPTRPIRPVPDVYDAEHTDEHVHAFCHWEGEWSLFEKELREWKKFLDYRQKKETDGETEVQLKERESAKGPTQVDLWREYRSYQQLEVENAKQWMDFWQRQVKHFQQKEGNYARQGWEDDAYRMHSEGETMQSHAEDARKQVKPAEIRLQWVEQQLSALFAECAVLSVEVSTSDLEAQAITPKRSSRSGQLKGLRSDRSGRSTMGSNLKPDKNKKRALASSTLGPIHSSKVSKAAGRKAPCPRRQSKIPAEHDNGQNQGPHTTISPSLPANVAPRRSSRLGNNQKKSGALEANLAADLGRSVQPPTTNIIMRRSDQISQQKERKSMSSSSTAVNSAMALQTDPSRRLSRSKPKGRRIGNKSDPSPAKPRGISKRQDDKISRKRTKIRS